MASVLQWMTSTLYNGQIPEGFGDLDFAGEETKIQYQSLKHATTYAVLHTVLGWLFSYKYLHWLRYGNLINTYASAIYHKKIVELLQTYNMMQLLLVGFVPLYATIAWVCLTPASWPISYHVAFIHHGASLAHTWWMYINNLEDFEEVRSAWLLAREPAFQYTLMAVAFQHWRELWAYILLLAVWAVLPVLLSTLIFALVISQVPNPDSWQAKAGHFYVTYINTPLVFSLMTLMSIITDLKDYAEIITMVWLPQALQLLRMRTQLSYLQRQALYRYTPLKHSHIRRLKILPGTGIIETEMCTTEVTFLLSYDAISYQWQSSHKTRLILVDGKRFPVTESAFQALLACRSIIEPRFVWIDAICINQEDDEEKEGQIKLMPLIYRQAITVRYFPTFNPWDRSAAFLIHSKTAAPGFDDVNKTPEHIRMTLGFIDQRWKAFVRVVKSEYWSRGWVTQEVALGGRRLVYLGGCWLPPGQITSFIGQQSQKQDVNTWLLASSRGKLTALDMCPQESLRALHQLYWHNGYSADDNLSFEQILLLTWQCRTTDPRDRAYAMLGIAAADKLFEDYNTKRADWRYMLEGTVDLAYDKGLALSASYKITPEDLFQKLAMIYFSRDTPTNHLLALAGTGYNTNRLDIPSWVPDLGEIRYSRPLTCLMEHEKPWCEAGTSVSPIMSLGRRQGSLVVSGVLRGSITLLNSGPPLLPIRKSFTATELAEQKRAFGRGALDLLEASSQIWPADARLKEYILLWTLIGGQGSAESLSPDDFDTAAYLNAVTLWVQIQARLATGKDLRYWMMKHFDPLPQDIAFLRYGKYIHIDRCIQEFSFGRQLALSSELRICVVPPLAQLGDLVFIPAGAQTPYLIRKRINSDEDEVYELVGEANVSGLQDGQASFDEMTEITLI